MNYYTFQAECAYLRLIRTGFSEVSSAAFAAATGQMKATSAPRQSPLNRAKEQRGRVAQAHSEAILFRTASCCKAVFANAVRATGCRIFMPYVAFACARALDV